MAAVGELIADKLPIVPSRIEPGPLLGRLAFGALAGAMIAKEEGRSPVAGGAVGASGAGIGAYSAFHIRRLLHEETGVPDPVLGALEDVIAIFLGLSALRATR
jgi:uncharacterized membrane protein